MNLERLPYDTSALVDFYEEGLSALGAICERSWHDRLQLIAEGPSARLWCPSGALTELELSFPSPESADARDAERQVFPGCPLTFRLVEALRSSTLVMNRAALQPFVQNRPPSPEVAAKLWHAQVPNCSRWTMTGEFKAAWHFSVLFLMRCEIQAIDQHWSLHRIALSLPDGNRDESLAAALEFALVEPSPETAITWPPLNGASLEPMLQKALREELAAELGSITLRQEQYLRRELDRVDRYFENYEKEITERQRRSRQEPTKFKITERLAAAKSEHERRRQDQISRHEIRIIPRVDALMLLAEPAWEASVQHVQNHEARNTQARFIPRNRRWMVISLGEVGL